MSTLFTLFAQNGAIFIAIFISPSQVEFLGLTLASLSALCRHFCFVIWIYAENGAILIAIFLSPSDALVILFTSVK